MNPFFLFILLQNISEVAVDSSGNRFELLACGHYVRGRVYGAKRRRCLKCLEKAPSELEAWKEATQRGRVQETEHAA